MFKYIPEAKKIPKNTNEDYKDSIKLISNLNDFIIAYTEDQLVLINKSKDLYEKANKILTGFDNILKFYKFLTKYKELD